MSFPALGLLQKKCHILCVLPWFALPGCGSCGASQPVAGSSGSSRGAEPCRVQPDCSLAFLAICFPSREVMCMLVVLPRIPPQQVLLFYLTRSPVCRRAGR